MWMLMCGTLLWSGGLWSGALWAGDYEQWVETLQAADRAHGAARFQEAADALVRAVGIAGGLDHADAHLAGTLLRLGSVYADMGQMRDAENAYLRALAAWERADSSDPERSAALMGLATVYTQLQEFGKAERFGRAAIEIREKAWGPGHPDVGAAYQNMAAVYQSERRYPEALEIYRRALEIMSTAGRPEDVATVRSNLGLLLAGMGRPEEAVAETRQAIDILETSGPRQQPRLAVGLTNLSAMYGLMGRWAEAEAPVERAREIVARVLGPGDLSLGPVLRTYADVLRHTGRKREARQMERQAEALRQEAAAQNLTGYTLDAKAYHP
ncbi:exported hypothetical protein [Candidatus Sulfopaludibacter sp. SbA4]|nr:exported hypothetical protein [Candidatus Sulfopaludibacter sp. SbA4]